MKSLLVVAALAVVSASAVKVPTPAGERPAECVHRIPAGTHVHRNKDGSDRLVFPDGSETHKASCHEYGKVHSNKKKALTTQKKKEKKENKHELEHFDKETDSPNDKYIGYSGWTTYTKWFFPKGVGQFIGTWNVPKEPVNASFPNPLYTFTALQNIDWVPIGNASGQPSNEPKHRPFDIIQPVMEFYGNEKDNPPSKGSQGGGRGWSISSWIVSLNGGNTYASHQTNVTVGTEVFGNMVKTGDRSWYINSVRQSDGANTALHLHYDADPDSRLNNQSWAYTAVECYGCTGCSTYPSDTLVYKDMSLWDMDGHAITPQWEDKVESEFHWCNEKVTTKSPGKVVYSFQNQE